MYERILCLLGMDTFLYLDLDCSTSSEAIQCLLTNFLVHVSCSLPTRSPRSAIAVINLTSHELASDACRMESDAIAQRCTLIIDVPPASSIQHASSKLVPPPVHDTPQRAPVVDQTMEIIEAAQHTHRGSTGSPGPKVAGEDPQRSGGARVKLREE